MEELDFSKPAREPVRAPAYDPAIALEFFSSAGKPERVPAGTRFFAENEKASRFFLQSDRMYLLLEGEVELTAKGRPVGSVQANQIFGEMAALSEAPRHATAIAKTACVVISLDDKALKSALAKKPEFAIMLMGTMIARLRGMLAAMTQVPSAAAQERDSRVFDKGLLAALARGLGDQVLVRYDSGKVIMVEGQVGALMYVVLEGRVVITLRGAVVQHVGPGGVFGELALIDQSTRAADATAETDCALLAINRNVFLNLVKADPTFGVSLLSAVAERVRNMAAGVN
ncbi:MAG TPA: cyclic nucleotide-binding domain-containing protein [Burkholderiales bacterium]|nr:cyclic nucleotide-binding domain-containing protein [Burkholderiales bacterium]